ncbi:hypothetical protein SDC9_196881 [bioreactor metagenome]|uniref:Uncharacterized protein n=1 Tax=bioreactor metagenome TaxID=1076179 RepID=A0A645IEB2_9ZZZZ
MGEVFTEEQHSTIRGDFYAVTHCQSPNRSGLFVLEFSVDKGDDRYGVASLPGS